MPLPALVVAVAGAIAIELAADGGVWVVRRAWDAASRRPIPDLKRPPRLYDEKTGLSFSLQGDGTYRVVDGPKQI